MLITGKRPAAAGIQPLTELIVVISRHVDLLMAADEFNKAGSGEVAGDRIDLPDVDDRRFRRPRKVFREHFLELIEAVFDTVVVVCRVRKDIFALRFEKQHILQREIKLLILFIKGDFFGGLGLFNDKLMDFLDRVIHAAAADCHFILRQVIDDLNTYFHRITSSCPNYIDSLRKCNSFFPTGVIYTPTGK